MSLDIQLSPFLTQQLYKNVLYDFVVKEDEKHNTSAPPYLGGYQKKILLLVEESNFPVIADKDLEFLTKILASCQLGMADIAVVNMTVNTVAAAELISHYKPHTAILFGVEQEMLGLPLRFPDFQVQPFNHCTYLSAPALPELEGNVTAKKEFWLCLRKLFSLN